MTVGCVHISERSCFEMTIRNGSKVALAQPTTYRSILRVLVIYLIARGNVLHVSHHDTSLRDLDCS